MLKNLPIAGDFQLIEKTLIKETEVKTVVQPIPVNFIFNIDVSGSMSWDLPKIRTQLKNKLPNLVKAGDTVTLIWFSGNKQAGVLKEEIEVRTLTNLQDLNEAIDRYLVPVGLTAFAKPLELTKEVIERISKNRPGSIFSLLFLTDGGNNDCSLSEVTKALKALEPELASASFIEYGYYADSRLLTTMAETVGGEKLSVSGFDDYDPIFESKITKTLSSTKKVQVNIDNSKFQFAFSIGTDNEVVVYGINDSGEILVNEDVSKVYYFSETIPAGSTAINFTDPSDTELAKVIYTSIYVLSDRMLNSDAEVIFGVLGDVYAFNMFNNSFGKQKLNDFKTYIRECISDETKRFLQGRKEKLVLDSNAYCFINLIDDLSALDDNLFYPKHPDFNYKLIGSAKVQANTKVSDEVKTQIASIDNVDELAKYVSNLQQTSPGELKFEYSNPEKGYAFSSLVWNESKANLSVMVRYTGKVKLPDNQFGLTEIDTFIFRNYTLVKDGILNLTKLPLSLNEATFNKLVAEGLIPSTTVYTAGEVYTVDFSVLPIINRSMVQKISANALAELEWKLQILQANKKVYDYYGKKLFPKVSTGFVDKYGKEAEEWLKTLGITEFNGFAPKMVSNPSGDFYLAAKLDTKIAGFSSLGKVEDVEKKVIAGTELKNGDKLMSVGVSDYLTQINSELYKSQTPEVQATILESWLKKATETFVAEKRATMLEIAKIKFALILSRGWFQEFASIEENKLDKTIDEYALKFTFDFKEEQVNL